MGCTGDREKGPPEHTQKWEFMTLSDFKATSIWTSLAYMWLWFMAIVAVAVYAADTFTAVNLLAFDKWNSQVQPTIPLKYSKWIFAACILLSWALCLYEWIRAIRVIKRGGVAESYMDPVAVTLQSMRGQGWRRFLVFTELTKSKKGTDYIAFFVYFAFNGAIRVILAEGPRQAVNAMTLYSVMNAKLIVHGTPTDGHSSIEQFFLNVEGLAEKNQEQAVILLSMLFTLVIWIFSALSLIFAAILYLVFLWHYIPQRDGRLSIYCRRKVDRRLEKIVEYKVKAALEEEERKLQKAERKADLKRQKTGELPQQPKMARQPTLPQLGNTPETKSEDKLPEFQLTRQDTNTTMTTLPPYSSRPPTRNGSQQQLSRQPTLPDVIAERPTMPSRNGTQASGWSNTSYESDAPLLQNAGYAGRGGRASPAPTMPPPAAFNRQDSNASYNRRFPVRTNTQGSQGTQRSYTPMSRMDTMNSQERPFSPMSQNGYSRPPPGPRGPPIRSNTGLSFQTEPQSAASPMSAQDMYGAGLMGALRRQDTQNTFQTVPERQASPESVYSRPTESIYSQPTDFDNRRTYGSLHSQQSSFSRPMVANRKPSQSSFNRPLSPPSRENQPTPQSNSYEMTSQPYHTGEPVQSAGGYVAFNPGADRTATPLSLQPGPKRNLTVAGQPGTAGNYFGHVQDTPQRSATAPIDARQTIGYTDILNDYGDSARSSILPPEQQQPLASQPQQSFSRPSPPTGLPRSHTAGPVEQSGMTRTSPPTGPQRSYTAGPDASAWHGNRF